MFELNGKLAYVVGESFSGLSNLPRVLTTTQFIKAVIDGSLSSDFIWMIGQGINNVERNLLQLCQQYRSDIRFYASHYETSSENKPDTVLHASNISKNIFSKLLQAMTAFLCAIKK